MKHIRCFKILLVLSVMFAVNHSVLAQNGAIREIWTDPAAFTRDQEITIYFDVTGTNVQDPAQAGESIFVWFFNDSGNASDPSIPNGPWDNFNTTGKMLSPVEGMTNVYSIKLTPETFFVDGSTMTEMEGLIRTGNGGEIKQTDNFDAKSNSAIVFYDYASGGISNAWPDNFQSDRPVSIIVDVSKAWSDGGTEQGQLVGQPVYIWLGANGFNPESKYNTLGNENAACKAVTGMENLFQYNFIPAQTMKGWDAVSPPPTLNELNWLFNNGTWTLTGRDVNGANFGKEVVREISSTAFATFPGKFTTEDLAKLTYNPALDIPMDEGGNVLADEGLLTGSVNIFGQFYVNGEKYGDKVLFENNGDGTYTLFLIYNSEAFMDLLKVEEGKWVPIPNSFGVKFTNTFGEIVSPLGENPPFKINMIAP
ncbi:hypothetical protein FUAX_21970 [Fulvitalea axinellae]|uniref:Uncharacterized protein n=1 Tax=Fulvitalea axinellae TaxID=1182444 RepID=A0AAU9DBL5_9BACT|nr:hypothetical protein FUAX_21970 [Fulvitalea axinellae]